MSTDFLHHDECPKCGSRDNVAVYSNGGRHCFTPGCNYHVSGETGEELQVTTPSNLQLGGVVASIHDRKLSLNTVKKYQVSVDYAPDGKIAKHFYPYHDANTGEIVGTKCRIVSTKDFLCTGNMTNVGLFGQRQCRGTGKYITITEGEVDAMSVYEMFGQKWDVVSLRSGASSAAKEIKAQLEWLEGYENVVICFDQDKAGELATDQI